MDTNNRITRDGRDDGPDNPRDDSDNFRAPGLEMSFGLAPPSDSADGASSV